MKKRMLTVLLVIVMVFGMLPFAAAGAETENGPVIKNVSVTLGGILGVNLKVDAKGADMTNYKIRVTGATQQTVSEYSMDGELCVFTAKLPAHRICESLTIELLNGEMVVETRENWTVQSYLDKLVELNPDHAELKVLRTAMLNYGAYAAYYADPSGTKPNVAAVEDIKPDTLEDYAHKMITDAPALGATASLFIDDACDLQVKFNESAWQNGYQLQIGGSNVSTQTADGRVRGALTGLLPQTWSDNYTVKVLDADGGTVMEYTYNPMAYAYAALKANTELQAGLNGLMKAMYLYQDAVVAFAKADKPVIEDNIIDEGDGPVIEF